jgi:hypothetical protein
MSGERSNDLAELCTELVRNESNPLVDGSPQSEMQGRRPVLKIPLITGERLVFDGDAKKFSVK